MHQLNLPINQNRGNFCAEYSIKSILDFFNLSLPIEQIISKIGREENKLICPIELVPFLHQQKINLVYFANKQELEETLRQGVRKKMEAFYGSEVGSSLYEKINPQNLLNCIAYVLENKIFLDKEPLAQELEDAISKSQVPLCLINMNLFHKEPNKFKGHYIYLAGFDEQNFYYHDTGPKSLGKNKLIEKNELISITKSLVWHDYGVLIISKSD